jgi:hypothetical protein
MTQQSINDLLMSAINGFLAEEQQLLAGGVREEALCHHLARDLQLQFAGWNVDTEYDKMHIDGLPAAKKYITSAGRERSAIPDIIVHHRQTTENLLALEIKRLGDLRGREEDFDKLRAYKSPPYSHQFTVFLELGWQDDRALAFVEYR